MAEFFGARLCRSLIEELFVALELIMIVKLKYCVLLRQVKIAEDR